mgnify:FL=1
MIDVKVNAGFLANIVSDDELNRVRVEAESAREKLMAGTGEGNDFLGWVKLPGGFEKEMMDNLVSEAERLAKMSETVVVIGIGGSYLGTRAVVEALASGRRKNRAANLVYAGHTIDPDYYAGLMTRLDREDYSVIVISKSGTTTEPAVAFRLIRRHLEKKYGREGANRRIAIITDARKGALHTIAEAEHYPQFVIPDNVGGRFSVLTPVGLLPIAAAGYDIEKLVGGASEMAEKCATARAFEDNPAMMYAALRNILYRKGYKVEVLTSFKYGLRYFSEWWKQLFGESEGKDGKGILPCSMNFTTDLHSLGQYMQDGERMLFETMLTVETSANEISVPNDIDNIDGLNYIADRSLTFVNNNALVGTREAHVEGGVPVIGLEVPRIDEKVMGELIYFFEYACGVSGYILGVNPFNQPGVEAYKTNMFRLLGKPGF